MFCTELNELVLVVDLDERPGSINGLKNVSAFSCNGEVLQYQQIINGLMYHCRPLILSGVSRTLALGGGSRGKARKSLWDHALQTFVNAGKRSS